MARTLEFGQDYVETLELADGTPVRLRPIQPSDKDQLARGLARLSPESRYLRFFTEKSHLSTQELAYLTEVDGVDHFALVAVHRETGEGIGVARFVRLAPEGDDAGDAHVAEAAVVVLDEFQNRGLGSLLLRRLSAAALERGIDRFAAEILGENQRIRHVLAAVSPDTEFVQDDDSIHAHVPLVAPAPDAPTDSLAHRLLAEVASGALELRHRLMVLKRTASS
ncbi:Acetyltransferase Pat [Enhygromyxa salina]|uniref:Acetyltransferase Pat n=1 Tax=Enhygromyxa salina TaxID=215803 RepID=A0A2S9XF97_9BACT|nr:GNAT family N-acetyltransferase [Enhygromyxa salina]PRP91532.1 Acetyltransferase Pat [Enhygromyxa salina]